MLSQIDDNNTVSNSSLTPRAVVQKVLKSAEHLRAEVVSERQFKLRGLAARIAKGTYLVSSQKTAEAFLAKI